MTDQQDAGSEDPVPMGKRWEPAGWDVEDPTVVDRGLDPTAILPEPEHRTVDSDLRPGSVVGLTCAYETAGGSRSFAWRGEIHMVFGQAAHLQDERVHGWHETLRPVAREDLVGKVFLKTTSSRNVFMVGANADGTFWECTLDNPGDQWTGEWDVVTDTVTSIVRFATGPYLVGLVGSTESTSLRGPEFESPEGLPQSFVWLTRLRDGQPSAPGSWAQGDEWNEIVRAALNIPRGTA